MSTPLPKKSTANAPPVAGLQTANALRTAPAIPRPVPVPSVSTLWLALPHFSAKEGVRASPCFLTYLKNRLEKSKQSTINFESDALVDELRCKLLDDMDEDMGNWAKEWKKPDLTREQRGALTKKLFIAGLGVEEYSGMWFYSFCRGNGQEDHCTIHCDVCGEWNDWREVSLFPYYIDIYFSEMTERACFLNCNEPFCSPRNNTDKLYSGIAKSAIAALTVYPCPAKAVEGSPICIMTPGGMRDTGVFDTKV